MESRRGGCSEAADEAANSGRRVVLEGQLACCEGFQ